MFVLFVIVAEILLLYWARQEPELLEYVFDAQGLSVGDELYPLRSLSGFAFVLDHPDDPYFELVFEQAKKVSSYLKVLVPVEVVDELYELLLAQLEEIDYEESYFEHIAKIIRF